MTLANRAAANPIALMIDGSSNTFSRDAESRKTRRLIEHGVGQRAANDKDLFDQVAAHREVFFPQTWVDYTALKAGRLRLLPLAEQEPSWRSDYAAMLEEMFSTTLPEFDVVLAIIRVFETKLQP